MNGLEQYVSAGILVAIRLSGLMVFAPLFSSSAIAPRIKAGFVFALTCLLAPVVGEVAGARVVLDAPSIAGELGVGLVFGLCLMILMESLMMAGSLMGMSFSFSLVNLMDPNTMVETAAGPDVELARPADDHRRGSRSGLAGRDGYQLSHGAGG